MARQRKSWTGILMAGFAAGISTLALMTARAEQDPPKETTEAFVESQQELGVDLPSFGYPDEWKVGSLDEASERVSFELLVPQHAAANDTNLTTAYVFPSGAVALQFPSPGAAKQFVRQEYIEVYEAPWSRDMNALTFYKKDLEADPSPAKSIVEIGGLSALVVEAHSPKDLWHSNPAFLRFVVNGIEVQISGGEDLGLLIEIAESIAKPQ